MHSAVACNFDICVIEDNADLNALLVQTLQASGYRAYGAPSVEAFERLLLERQPDLFVLDLNLPGEDGTSFARRVRSRRPEVGIIMLTARNDMDERRKGYETGADIYLTKPSSIDELLGAVGALARRIGAAPQTETHATAEGIVLNHRRLELTGPQGRVRLTAEEADILAAAAANPDGRVSIEEIRTALNRGEDLSKSAIEIKIVRLRKKISEAGIEDRAIASVRNQGYHLMVRCELEQA